MRREISLLRRGSVITKTVTKRCDSRVSRGVLASHRVTAKPAILLTEHHGTARHEQLPKLDVAGSIPVARSNEDGGLRPPVAFGGSSAGSWLGSTAGRRWGNSRKGDRDVPRGAPRPAQGGCTTPPYPASGTSLHCPPGVVAKKSETQIWHLGAVDTFSGARIDSRHVQPPG
jgi:hypothetical protein